MREVSLFLIIVSELGALVYVLIKWSQNPVFDSWLFILVLVLIGALAGTVSATNNILK